jgi:hypothetical protein
MFIIDFFKSLAGIPKTGVYSVGPNSFAELLKQFDQPSKEKTQEDIIRDYQVKETMAALELDMLKMDPAISYRGFQRWVDGENIVSFDWMPCVVRPDILYCSYGKN